MTACFLSPLFRFPAGWTFHWVIFLVGLIHLVSSPANAQEIAVFDGNGTLPADERVDNQGTHLFTGNGQTHPFTIKNTGLAALSGLRWDIIGPAAGDFVLDSSSSAALAPGATASFGVTFASAAPDARVAIIRIFSNDPDENPFDIILSGTGGSPEISVEQPAGAELAGQSFFAWGKNDYGQTKIPAGLSAVQAIVASGGHTVALKAEGTVVAWGRNDYGQTTIPAGLSGVQAIAASGGHTVALKADGTLFAWGHNTYGQTTIPPGLSGVQAIAAGGYHTVALKADGTVVAWGRKDDGVTTIPPSLSGVKAIAAGGYHTLAFTGSVIGFGKQSISTFGEPKSFLIKNTGTGKLNITGVKALGSHAADFKVDTGGMTTSLPALDGQTTFTVAFMPSVKGYREARLQVLNDDADEGLFEILLTGYSPYDADIAVFDGSSTTPADERLNHVGTRDFPATLLGKSLSQSFTIKNTGPSDSLSNLRWDFIGPEAGDFNITSLGTSALAPNATATFGVVFGPKALGARVATLRIFSNDPDENPFEINLSGMGVTPEISIADQAGTPLENSRIISWGLNSDGQLAIPAGLVGVQAIAAGNYHTVALKADGTVVTWGRSWDVRLAIPANLTGVKAIAVGALHSVALRSDGTLVAWGSSSNGQTTIPAGLSGVQVIAARGNHTVALKSDGKVVAWGNNTSGQTAVPAGLSDVQAISTGELHTVALKSNGTVVAWGSNNEGQTTIPVNLSGIEAIAAGGGHTLALNRDGTLRAWGRNLQGQTTVPAGLTDVKAIAAGGYHSVALKHNGTVTGWGYNAPGATTMPVGLSGVQAIAAGEYHTVAIVGSKLAFGDQTSSPASLPKKITIRNTGTAALQITSVAVVGEHASDFTVDSTGMLTSIPPLNGQTTFSVTFHPSAPGTRSARLLVKNDDLDEGDYVIWLTGENTPPQAVAAIPDQEVRIGTPLTMALPSYFIDPDGEPLAYSLITNSNPAAATATLSGSSLQITGLAPGLTEITLLASDTPGGSITGTLRVRTVNEFTVPSSAPQLELSQAARLADGSVLLQINAIPGRSYQVETSPNLIQWTSVPLPIQAGATKIQYIDHDAPPGTLKRYYRVREIAR